jgi:flagellum-specific peptidoglycan hydrolase FlgJ
MLSRCSRVPARLASMVIALTVLVASGPWVGATSAAEETPRTGDAAQVTAAASAAIDLERTAAELRRVSAQLDDLQSDVGTTQASLNVTVGELVVNQSQLDGVKQRVRERGALAYTKSGAGSTAPLDVDRAADVAAARHYTSSAIDVDTTDLSRLQDVEAKLEQERAEKAALHDDAVAKRNDAQARHDQLSAQRDREQVVLDRIGGVPVMGTSVLSATQLADWYRSTGAVPKLAPDTTIDDIAALYIDEGADEGVRGDFAFAQAIIETGSFGVAAGNNYSGIGVCDSCTGGYGFPSPRDGVRAQIQLLRNYADPDSRADNLAHPPSPALYGADPAKAARLYDTFFLKGKAPLWNQMGGGNWATDPTYAGKVIGLFNQMVLFVNAHPEVR